MRNLLFVYGTLSPNSKVLDNLGIQYDVLGNASIKARKKRGTEYPALVKSNSGNLEDIKGVLIQLRNPKYLWPILDKYEEYYPDRKYSSLYIRERTEIRFKGKRVKAWVYWFNEI